MSACRPLMPDAELNLNRVLLVYYVKSFRNSRLDEADALRQMILEVGSFPRANVEAITLGLWR